MEDTSVSIWFISEWLFLVEFSVISVSIISYTLLYESKFVTFLFWMCAGIMRGRACDIYRKGAKMLKAAKEIQRVGQKSMFTKRRCDFPNPLEYNKKTKERQTKRQNSYENNYIERTWLLFPNPNG